MKRFHSYLVIYLILISCMSLKAQEQTQEENAAVQSFKVAPSYFIPNTESQKTGKTLVNDQNVTAFVQTQKGRVMFTPSGAYIGITVLADEPYSPDPEHHFLEKTGDPEIPEIKTRTVVMKAGFSNNQAKKHGIVPRLEEATAGTVNFMVGSRDKWRTKVPTYRKLVYDQVWEGIALEYLGFMDRLEFRLLLDAGSDPHQIAIETGGEELLILEDGSMRVFLAGAELVLSRPFAFQKIDDKTIEIPVRYKILSGNKLGFILGVYSPNYALVIDPILSWSTYLGGPGGEGDEFVKEIAVDSFGNAYITGYTPSADYPSTTGSYDDSWNGGQHDVFVSKLSSTGNTLVYSTFIGGTSSDHGNGIAVGSTGCSYVTGYTKSNDFPTTSGSYDEIHNGFSDGFSDVFVSKLSSDGSSLIYSTFIGGTSFDIANAIAVNSTGNAFVTGYTKSSDYPTTSGSYDETRSGYYDAFVSKLSSDGSSLIYSTFLGGTSSDIGYSIAVNSTGNAYVTGGTASSNYPTTSGSYDETRNGSYDAFVSKLSSDGSSLIYSTFLGGTSSDYGYSIAVDSTGNAYVTGRTESSSYPTTSGSYNDTFSGSYDAFVSKLSNDGSGLIYSTFLGGTDDDYGLGIAVDNSGNAYVTGDTNSSGYPTISGSYDETYNGSWDLFVSKLNSDGSSLIYSTFLGGTNAEQGSGIAVGSTGNVYVTGRTYSSGYPTTSGSYDETHNGPQDAFVSKLSSDGSSLISSTFIGGTDEEQGNGIAVDSTGNAYVMGYAWSNGYPTTSGSYDETHNMDSDVFVSKLSRDGGSLIYSTFIGGSDEDKGNGIAVNSTGNAYVMGYTRSSDYPTTNESFDGTHNGSYDVFVSKLNSNGDGLIYSTFIGGTDEEQGTGIAVGSTGCSYVTGYTKSIDFPTTSGTYDETFNGNDDVFVSKLSSDGSSLIYSTFIGGTDEEQGTGIAVGSTGCSYVTGYTKSNDFPTTSGAFDETFNGWHDVFVSKLSIDGSSLIYSTFTGGTRHDMGYGIAVDSSGNAYVTGRTESDDYPSTSGTFDETHNGFADAFVSKLNSDGNGLIFSTFLGGTDYDQGYGIAVDSIGNAYVTGFTNWGWSYPTTSGAFDETYNGGTDVFMTKLSSDGRGLVYSTYLGGTDNDIGFGIAVDSIGNAYVTGNTKSSDYPITNGVVNEVQNGYGDAFVFKLSFELDFNNDSCSNYDDLLDLLPYWPYGVILNHSVSVLDFLLIDFDGPIPCP